MKGKVLRILENHYDGHDRKAKEHCDRKNDRFRRYDDDAEDDYF